MLEIKLGNPWRCAFQLPVLAQGPRDSCGAPWARGGTRTLPRRTYSQKGLCTRAMRSGTVLLTACATALSAATCPTNGDVSTHTGADPMFRFLPHGLSDQSRGGSRALAVAQLPANERGVHLARVGDCVARHGLSPAEHRLQCSSQELRNCKRKRALVRGRGSQFNSVRVLNAFNNCKTGTWLARAGCSL